MIRICIYQKVLCTVPLRASSAEHALFCFFEASSFCSLFMNTDGPLGRLLCNTFLGSEIDPFCPFVCDFIFEHPCTSVPSYARLHVKTSISIFSYSTDTPRTTYDTRYRYHVLYQVFIASSSSQQVPRSNCCMKRMTPL